MGLSFRTAADVFDGWRNDLLMGRAPTLYRVGTGEWGRVETGPGLVSLFGGAPGAGKTALVMQMTFEALRLTKDLRALVCNVEMPPEVLLDRQLARLAGLPAELIRRRKLGTPHGTRLAAGLHELENLSDRLAFVRAPFTLENVTRAADDFGAEMLVIDYVQRIQPPGKHGDRRSAVNALMDFLRQFADAGLAVLVIAAVGRTKDQQGRSSYDAGGLNLASFRESSELEFGADSAWLLAPDREAEDLVALRCLKNRHGETVDLPLRFDKPYQRFTPLGGSAGVSAGDEELQASLESLWQGASDTDRRLGEDKEGSIDGEA